MRADNEAAVTWVRRCHEGGEKAGEGRGITEDGGGMGSQGKVVFPGKA